MIIPYSVPFDFKMLLLWFDGFVYYIYSTLPLQIYSPENNQSNDLDMGGAFDTAKREGDELSPQKRRENQRRYVSGEVVPLTWELQQRKQARKQKAATIHPFTPIDPLPSHTKATFLTQSLPPTPPNQIKYASRRIWSW
jgi:hypothetical protein